jgi:hypothetical protein
MAASIATSNGRVADRNGGKMPNAQDGGRDLLKCKGVTISIDRASGIYKASDTAVLTIRNLTSDSTLISVGLEGKSNRWRPVVNDVFRFVDNGERMSDDVATKILKPLDSVKVKVAFLRLHSLQRKYRKWHFYVYEFSFPPIVDFKCYAESISFTMK